MPDVHSAQCGSCLGARAKARRLELGMTQDELAGEVFSRGYISQIENGYAEPSLASLRHIAARLGRPVSWFLGEENQQDVVTGLTQDELHRLLRLRLLSDEQLKLLERLANELRGCTEELADALNLLRWLKTLTPGQRRVLRGLMREFGV